MKFQKLSLLLFRGNLLATGGIDRIVRLINVPSRTFLITKANGFLKGHNSPVTYVGIQAKENRLISTSQVECIVQVQRIFSTNFNFIVNIIIFWVITCLKIVIFLFTGQRYSNLGYLWANLSSYAESQNTSNPRWLQESS